MKVTSYPNHNSPFFEKSQAHSLDEPKKLLIDEYGVGDTYLDIGGGIGYYSQYLQSQESYPILLELNYSLLSQAKVTDKLQADVSQTPLQDKSIDTTLMFDILEHVDELALSEVHRVTKKRLIGTVPRTTDPELSHAFLLYGHYLDPTHLRTYNSKTLRNVLETYRFKVIHLTPSHPIPFDSLFLDLFEGPLILKKILRKLNFAILRKKTFYSNLSFVAEPIA